MGRVSLPARGRGGGGPRPDVRTFDFPVLFKLVLAALGSFSEAPEVHLLYGNQAEGIWILLGGERLATEVGVPVLCAVCVAQVRRGSPSSSDLSTTPCRSSNVVDAPIAGQLSHLKCRPIICMVAMA